MTDDSPGFFRSLSGLATDWVQTKRRALKTEPETKVDSSGASTSYSFDGQDVSFEDLRDIRDMREAGGQIAQLMTSKALLNFGEGAEFHVENDEETEEIVDGEPMTLTEWLEANFPHLDLLVLDLGEDALWYPYAVGETLENRAGEFKKLLPAEPWTIMPVTNEQGQVVGWHQRVKQSGGYQEQTLGKDDLWHIVLNKSSARDETGISEVLRSKDEIQAFKENEQAINQAIELHGFPQRHVKVGKEDGAPVRDGDLRRVRTIFDPHTSDANTAYFTGQDVNVDTLEAHQFDYQAIHEMDMRNLTTALGLPLEAGNVGSDGLGSGKPAELRFALLKLAIKANQRKFSHQFVDKVLRPVIREYSPFDADEQVSIEIDDPLEDVGEVADLLNKVGKYMTNSEARRMLDLSEPEDDEIAEAYRSPADIEKSEAGDPVDDSPFGGMFSDDRELQTPEGVPENATSVSDSSECDGSVVKGPKGGTYCVPKGEGGDTNQPPPSVDLSKEQDSVTPEEFGIVDGSNHAEMRISQLEDGSTAFVHENYDAGTAEAELAGVAVYESLGLPVPDHHYYEDSGEMAKQGINGQTLRDAVREGGFDADVDQESVVDAFAASLITGDTDMHGGNMIIRDDGTAMPIDLEGSGGPVRDKSDKEAKVQTMLDEAGIDVEYDEVWNRAQELAGDLNPDDIPEGEEMLGEIASDNIRDNIEAIQP